MAVLHINYDIETVNGVVYLITVGEGTVRIETVNGGVSDRDRQEEGELARVAGHASAIPGVRHVADHVIAKITRAICLYLTAARARDEHALGVARRSVVATTICQWLRETAII